MSDLPTFEETHDEFFVRARFAGGRFNSHAIPFDVLPDLAAYRDLIVEVAKHLYLSDNKSRKRLPKHFERSFELSLTEIIRGNSATAVAHKFEWSDHRVRQPKLDFPSYFEAARDLVDDTIIAANDDGPISLPIELVKKFTPFGRNLRSDESIEISEPGRSRVAVFNREIRKRIILTAESSYEDYLDRDFILNGAKVSSNNIHLLDERGVEFEARAQTPEQLEEALLRSRGRQKVHITGIGMFNREDELVRIISIEEPVYIDDEPRAGIDAQLDRLASMEDGWHNGQGLAPSQVAIECAQRVLALIEAGSDAGVPFIYPTYEGGVTAEWTHHAWEISVSIPTSAHAIEFYMLNTETDQEFELISDHDTSVVGAFVEKWAEIAEQEGE